MSSPPASTLKLVLPAVALAGVLAACGDTTQLPAGAESGRTPTIVQPVRTLIPTVNVAPARGWPAGVTPRAAEGTQVSAFATALAHPRWLIVLPNGDVLVAESNAPERPEGQQGLKGQAMKFFMQRAGAGVPSANRITLLRDADGDGQPELRTTFVEGLNSPFGMALVGQRFYVANTDAVLAFEYQAGQTQLRGPPTRVTDLPAGPLNHHWTKNLLANPDGSRLYVSVGSNSNVAENGLAAEEGRAAIWELDPASGSKRPFASGLRNPNGMAWGADGKTLWTVVNERDELGSDLVPDYLTSVADGGFYGWPYSYFGRNVDARVQPPRPDRVAQALTPTYALGAHVAPLGLVASAGSRLPAPFGDGMFVGLHGSWNRRPHSGYKVVFVPFREGLPDAQPIDLLTGFLSPEGEAHGRPVGVAVDRRGGLLVADDVGNTVWRVTTRPPKQDR
jgi:glucose/arabinose dehydrogenase